MLAFITSFSLDPLHEVKTLKKSNQYQRITVIFHQGISKKAVNNIASIKPNREREREREKEAVKMIQFIDDLSRTIKRFAFDSER